MSTIHTVRPTSVNFRSPGTTWFEEPAGSVNNNTDLKNAVSDNSDSTWIDEEADGASGVLNFLCTNPASFNAATQRIYSVLSRIRNARDATGPATQATQLNFNRVSGSSSTTIGFWTSKRTTTAITTFSGPKVLTSSYGKEWVSSDVTNNLCLVVDSNDVTNQGNNFFANQRIYELYADIDIHTQPIVSGVAASNFTNNSTPTISYVYSDPDNVDTMVAYVVRVFDAATIAGSGFNPDTSTPIWDSGFIANDNLSVVTGPLQNGVTYTAYVRVAKTFPLNTSQQSSAWVNTHLPQDGKWWSAWANSSTFTVTFTPPFPPVINSAVVLADTNAYRAMIKTLVPINLLTADNSDFEVTIGQWVSLANCTVVRDTAQHANGVASMKMTSAAAGDMTAICNLAFGTPAVDPLQTYTVVAQFKSAVSARSCAVGIRWINQAGGTISTTYGGTVTDSTANFNATASFTAAAPAGAVSGQVTVKVVATGAASEVHWVDKVSFHAGSTVSWMSGGFSDNQGDLLVERGEPVATTQGEWTNWLTLQVASAGTNELSTNGLAYSAVDWNSSFKWLDQIIPESGDTPAGMWRLTPLTATASNFRVGAYFFGGTDYSPPVVQSAAHTASLWAWVDTGTWATSIQINWLDATGALISSSTANAATLTTTPQRLSVTATAPANAFLASIQINNTGSNMGRHVFVTRCGFGPGTTNVDGRRGCGTILSQSWSALQFTGVDNPFNPGQTNFPPGNNYGQIEAIPDYDYPPGRPVFYRASITYTAQDGIQVITSAYSNFANVFGPPPVQTLLRSVTNPTLQVAVNRRKEVQYAITDDAQIFHPLGADAAPIQVRDWLGGQDGQLIALVGSEPQASRMHDILRSNDVLLIQWAQGGRTYVLLTDRSIDNTISSDVDYCDVDGLHTWLRYEVLTLSYVETAAP